MEPIRFQSPESQSVDPGELEDSVGSACACVRVCVCVCVCTHLCICKSLHSWVLGQYISKLSDAKLEVPLKYKMYAVLKLAISLKEISTQRPAGKLGLMCIHLIPALGRWTQEDQEFKAITSYTPFKASLGYIKLTERGETDKQTN